MNDNIHSFIEKNQKKYPYIQKEDIYKLIFQACFLTGHIIDNDGDSYYYLLNEYHDAFNLSLHKELYEFIDSDVVRVNLETFGFNLIELFNCVKKSSFVKLDKDFDKLLKEYNLVKLDGIPHHSDIYKKKYNPSYRVCYLDYLPVTYRIYKLSKFIIDNASDKELFILAIDGYPFSGKSMIASRIPDATIIDTTNQNLYEIDKLLSSLKPGKHYTYYKRCGELDLRMDGICKNVVVVEGRRSYVNFLRKHYDGLAYVVMNRKEIEKRNRNGEIIDKELMDYYDSFDFIKNANILL